MTISRRARRLIDSLSALLLGLALVVLGGGAAGAAPDPLNTGVTVNPLKAACENEAPTCNHVGSTNGWFNGEDVKFLYTQQFFCDKSVPSGATTGCEAGTAYKSLPPGTAPGAIDPLYIPVPLFKNPTPSYVQCRATPMCIDHPATVDLSALASVLGAPAAALKNAMLPGHDHIIADRANDRPEWWPITVVGVADQASWTAITTGKSYAAMKAAETASPKTVLEVPTNAFLWFQVLPGHVASAEANTNSNAVPPASTNGLAIDNLKDHCTTTEIGCNKDYIGQTRAFLGDTTMSQGSDVNLLYSGPFFCDASVQKPGANPCEAGQKATKVPPDITSAQFTDPLYIPTPLFKQPVPDLQCPSGQPCIDHPMTADLSRLAATLGVPAAALANYNLPGHDHIITDRNSDQPEWWPVTVIGVTNPQSFALITQAKSYAEVKKLEANPANGVLEVPTNIYLFFQTIPGTGLPTAPFTPIPVGPPNTGQGSTTGGLNPALTGIGVALLASAAGTGVVAYRRRRVTTAS
ncbi:MAG: hypothetical protein ABJB98_11075 [Actinomycetota bacterium]